MSFVPERRYLLSSSQQSTSYDTFVAPAEGDGSASTVSTVEGQSSTLEGQQELVQNHIFQISSEATNDREPVQQRNKLYLCSYNPLRYLIIAFGLWSDMGRCSMCLIIPVVIALTLPVEIYLASNVDCNIKGDGFGGGYAKTDLDLWVTQSMELLSYLLMAYSVRKLRKHRQAIRLSQAFRLAKRTIWLNFILLVSVCLIVLSVVTRNYSIPQDGLHYVFREPHGEMQYEISGVKNQKIYLAWRLVSSVVTWQPVICCLLFDVIMKALATLVDQCLKRIITMRAESVKYYIQIHQELCCKAESTFLVFKVWLTFNVLAFIFLLFWNGIRKSISLFGPDSSDEYFRSLCYGPIQDDSLYGLLMFYYLCTMFLYILFNAYFPWRSMACLRHSFSHLVQVLNDKADWDPEHPFNDRFKLNCFIQYANIAERRPFMNFTFRSIIPYLSILLAVYGISLALYHQFENEGHQ